MKLFYYWGAEVQPVCPILQISLTYLSKEVYRQCAYCSNGDLPFDKINKVIVYNLLFPGNVKKLTFLCFSLFLKWQTRSEDWLKMYAYSKIKFCAKRGSKLKSRPKKCYFYAGELKVLAGTHWTGHLTKPMKLRGREVGLEKHTCPPPPKKTKKNATFILHWNFFDYLW